MAFFVWVAVAGVQADVNTFTQALRADDFAAADLGKLSAEELARLNALVRAYKNGALAEAKREVAVVAATTAASAEPAKKAEGGLLAKAKVLLTPGTEIEYATVESRIEGNFTGWEGRAVLKLENGQRWQIANGGFYSAPPIPNPKVKIVPASLGGFWMTIEGVASRVRVQPFGAK
jgi:predicted secreted protein